MQATGTITNGRTGPLHHLPNRAKHPVGNRAKEKSSGSFGSRNAFLTTQLKPIYTQQLVCEWDDEKTNYITQENYEYLRDSYFRYARLLNKVPHHQPGKSIGEGIHNLYQQMNELSGNQINVNIEFEGNRLCFRLWQTHGWGAYTLYWFPVKFVESLNTKLRRIAITFLHELMKSNGLDTINDADDFEFMLEMFSCDIETSEDDKERKRYTALLNSYQQGGKAYRLLQRVEHNAYYKNISAALSRYQPQNDYEQTLITLMQEGLQFIGKDKPSIVGYSYDPYFDEQHDWPPMDICQQIRLIYDTSDTMNEYMVDHFNSNCRESYELVPTTTLDLSPDITTLFSMDDYPERFFEWADRFTYHIT